MSYKKAMNLLREKTKDHPPECMCDLCVVKDVVRGVDSSRPEKHTITKEALVSTAERGDEFVEAHESFGMLNLSRVSCSSAATLFGSDMKHGNYIKLEIHRAERRRDLSRD